MAKPKRSGRRWLRWSAVAAALLVILGLGFVIGARLTLRLRRHGTRSPMADLSHELQVEIQRATDGKTPGDIRSVIELSMQVTGKFLHFGLSHPTRLRFDKQPREANCIEYSTLFASVFNQLARWAKLKAIASLVHSDEARIFGWQPKSLAFSNHDWVVIEDRDGPRWYVDPTFADYWLGWNLDGNVEGDVPKAW